MTGALPFSSDTSQAGEVIEQPLLEIHQSCAPPSTTSSQTPPTDDPLAIAKVLAFEILVGERSIKSIMLKQRADTENPKEDCYQALVVTKRRIKARHIRPLGDAKILLYETTKSLITDPLGLELEFATDKSGREVPYLQPIMPFSLQVRMSNEHIAEAYQRIHEEKWQRTSSYKDVIKSDEAQFGIEILQLMQYYGGDFEAARKEWENLGSKRSILEENDVNRALGVAPFTVIQSILKEGWGQGSPVAPGSVRSVRQRRHARPTARKDK